MSTATLSRILPVALMAGAALLTLLAGLGAPVALGLGLLTSLVLRRLDLQCPAFVESLGPWLLRIGVVALGAGLELSRVLRVGMDGFFVTLLTLSLTLALGRALSRRFRVEGDVGILVTVGTGICGGSAVAATAPALRARPEHIGIALGVIFTLNAAALIVFPPLGYLLGLSPEAFARWCALAIHDTSSVVGAASAFDPASLELATITKLARALWSVPVVTGLAFLRARSSGESAGRVRVPGFILAFLAVAALRSVVPALAPAADAVASIARPLFVLALFATGLTLRLDGFLGRARSAAFLGTILWLVTATCALVLV